MNKRPDFSLIDLEKVRKRKKRELSDLEKQEIVEAFKLFDSDNYEKLDYHELKVRHLNDSCSSNILNVNVKIRWL